jgi:hypothetical protein
MPPSAALSTPTTPYPPTVASTSITTFASPTIKAHMPRCTARNGGVDHLGCHRGKAPCVWSQSPSLGSRLTKGSGVGRNITHPPPSVGDIVSAGKRRCSGRTDGPTSNSRRARGVEIGHGVLWILESHPVLPASAVQKCTYEPAWNYWILVKRRRVGFCLIWESGTSAPRAFGYACCGWDA